MRAPYAPYDPNEPVRCQFCNEPGPAKLFDERWVLNEDKRHFVCGRCLGKVKHEQDHWLVEAYLDVARRFPKGSNRLLGLDLRKLVKAGLVALCAPYEEPLD